MNARELVSRLSVSVLLCGLGACGSDGDSDEAVDAATPEDDGDLDGADDEEIDAGPPDASSDDEVDDGSPVDDAGAPDAGDDLDAGLDASVALDAGADASVVLDAGADASVVLDAGDDAGGEPLVCNGATELCDRAFNEVAYPATHNAMSAELEGFANSDQRYGIGQQLADGIRAMELDVWYFDPEDGDRELYLCHGGGCSPGRRRFSEALAEIATFLVEHPGDVLTLLFEDHVPGADILAALDAAGLRTHTHDQPLGEAWPTLRELIEADTRLVTLYENQGGTTEPYPAGYQVTWDYAWDTTWEFTQPSDFDDPEGGDCALYRGGDGTRSLFILNHMLDTDAQAEEFAETVNLEASLLARAEKCRAKSGQIPNFVKVDYYDVGDLFTSIQKLNGLP